MLIQLAKVLLAEILLPVPVIQAVLRRYLLHQVAVFLELQQPLLQLVVRPAGALQLLRNL